MKTLLVLVVALSATVSHAALSEGHCTPLVDSKVYLTNNFSASYPKTVEFKCTYECMNQRALEKVVATSSVRINNVSDDAQLVVCQGVKTRPVPWGWDFDGVAPFYAFSTAMPELKEYAFERVTRNPTTEAKLLTELKTTLTTVGQSFRTTGVATFVAAGDELLAIAAELPQKTTRLERAIKLIVDKRGVIPSDASTFSLWAMQIRTHAHWRVPTHLF